MATDQIIEEVRGFDVSRLEVLTGLPDWRVRRELNVAVSVGAVTATRVGPVWLLPREQLPQFKNWLRKRGLVSEEAITV
jgi:hypothetical protein